MPTTCSGGWRCPASSWPATSSRPTAGPHRRHERDSLNDSRETLQYLVEARQHDHDIYRRAAADPPHLAGRRAELTLQYETRRVGKEWVRPCITLLSSRHSHKKPSTCLL